MMTRLVKKDQSIDKLTTLKQCNASILLKLETELISELQVGVDFINFLRPIRALRPTFEKLFTGVRRALRRAPSFDRAISMIRALRPTFMKSTLDHQCHLQQ